MELTSSEEYGESGWRIPLDTYCDEPGNDGEIQEPGNTGNGMSETEGKLNRIKIIDLVKPSSDLRMKMHFREEETI